MLSSGRATQILQMRAYGKVEPRKLQRDRTFGRQAVKVVARGFLLTILFPWPYFLASCWLVANVVVLTGC